MIPAKQEEEPAAGRVSKIPFWAKRANTASVSGLKARRAPNESEIWPTTAVLPN